MAKDPAILWYWSDWFSGTSLMSRYLKGCYMDILHAQFNHGHLSLEEIKTCLGSDFGQAWPTLQKKFKQDKNGLFFNERQDLEKEKREKFSSSRRENINKRYQKSTLVDTSVTHMNLHMENENININTEDNKEGGTGEEKEGEANFKHLPDQTCIEMELPEIDVGGTIQYVRLTTKHIITNEQVIDFWEAFKLHHFNGKKHYSDFSAIKEHFRNWIKKQDHAAKSTTKTGGLGPKNGGFALLAESLKADMANLGHRKSGGAGT